MRHASLWILCLAWFVSGCGRDGAPLPSAPAVVPPPSTVRAPSAYFNVNWRVPDVFSPISAGEVINQRVTSQDPQCDPRYAARCQFYRYVASLDGLFEVAMAWKSLQTYRLDIDVTDPDAVTWDVTFVAANERRVQLHVKGGTVYWVTIWSADAPGEPFVLTASLPAD
jgi:hypothetical protein